jgi:hypothetical protein
MENLDKSTSFKKLLDRLQEDSWQLELLISGFAIFGLFYALEPISHMLGVAQFDNNQIFVYFFIIVYFSLQILIFNLLLHVLLRAIWIGSLGMRYVFGEIDYDNLNYTEQFTKYLKKNVGSFDSYIHKLENLCSTIFAITFLLVFYVFSFFIISFLLIAFNTEVPDWMIWIWRFLFVLFAIGALLTFFDFISQGLLKKNKWVAKLYFPFYWVFGFLTLSFLYRSLSYNLLDSKNGRRLSFALIPFYILIYIAFHLEYRKSNFINTDTTMISSSFVANARNYQDEIKKDKNLFIGEFAIQSKVIVDPYIKITVPLSTQIEDGLIEFNPSLKPEIERRGLHFQPEITVTINDFEIDGVSEAYLSTFNNKHRIKIDTTTYPAEFLITNTANEFAFESYLGTQGLSEGKHILEFLRVKHLGTDSLVSIGAIPFWYYKE